MPQKASSYRSASPEAFYTDADTVLEGAYYPGAQSVSVSLFLKRADGCLLNSAAVEIDKSLISRRLDNGEAQTLIQLADTGSEQGTKMIRVFTSKGGDFPVYYHEEKIQFFLQAAAPLFIYLYDINAAGEVSRLYPYPYEKGQVPERLLPGSICAIPAETDEFEFKVAPPFGMDAVKVFASASALPIPELSAHVASRSFSGDTRAAPGPRGIIQEGLSAMPRINPKDLVDYYRGVARRLGVAVYEDSLILETKGKR